MKRVFAALGVMFAVASCSSSGGPGPASTGSPDQTGTADDGGGDGAAAGSACSAYPVKGCSQGQTCCLGPPLDLR